MAIHRTGIYSSYTVLKIFYLMYALYIISLNAPFKVKCVCVHVCVWHLGKKFVL